MRGERDNKGPEALSMRIVDDYGAVPAFEIIAPEGGARTPFVFNAPHSGAVYTRGLVEGSALDRQALRRSEDTFVDSLFRRVTELGAPLLRANFPRAFVDLNRAPNELDPQMFSGTLDVPVARESPRVAGGLGVIARVVGDRQEIYGAPLPPQEARRRLDTLYHPYHAQLAALIEEMVARFDTCVLVDCHSMPSGAVKASGVTGRADVIIGDRFGTSCAGSLTETVARLLRRENLAAGLNRPYAGGYITEHYGRPPIVHALQLEINRGLYMDETTYTRHDGFVALEDKLMRVCAGAIDAFAGLGSAERWPLAAE
ncbi:MAG: N-formylglutamate amidohydrolase [Acuticoccus sp.]